MNVSDFFSDLQSLIEEMDRQIPGLDWYLFGSTLRNAREANDIDLLVVCPFGEEADRLRCLVRECDLYPLLDLSIFTREEEAEGGFVELNSSIPLRGFLRTYLAKN